MFVKILGGCFLVGASFLTGCVCSGKLYKRREFLKNFLVFLNSVATHMRYDSADIFRLVSLCAQSGGLDCFKINEEASRPFADIWNGSAEKSAKAYSLTKSDKDLLLEFGSELGKTDVEGQLKHIELYKAQFSKQLFEAEENIKQKAKLYKAMGFFVGASAALMML